MELDGFISTPQNSGIQNNEYFRSLYYHSVTLVTDEKLRNNFRLVNPLR